MTLFMKFHQPGEYGTDIWINMAQVSHIMPTTLGSVITFNAIIDNVPAYMLVTETPEIIEARLELKYR